MQRSVTTVLSVISILSAGCAFASSPADLPGMIARIKPTVLYVKYRSPGGGVKSGTGFFIDKQVIITCAHVVSPETSSKKNSVSPKIWVRTSDGKTMDAQCTDRWPDLDLAVLRISASYVGKPLVCSNAKIIQGQDIFVLGYPLGQAIGSEITVTRGLVSAVRAEGAILQLDAAMNPGNSGGPVVDSAGNLVGVAFARIPGAEGMGFAVTLTDSLVRALLDGDTKFLPAVKLGKSRLPTDPLQDLRQTKSESIYKSIKDKPKDELDQLLLKAARSGDVASAHACITAGADMESRDDDGWSPLFAAVSLGNTEMAELLIEHGADVTSPVSGGMTPLHGAASCLNSPPASLIGLLISKGAEIDCTDNRGWTPASWAAMTGNLDVVKTLHKHGADLKHVDIMGVPLIHSAAHYGRTAVVKYMLDNGLDVETCDNSGTTTLEAAVSSKDASADTVRLLLDRLAEPNTKDKLGLSPLYLASLFNRADIVRLLADNDADVDELDENGSNLLHRFAREADPPVDALGALIAAGLDVNARDKAGFTGLHLVCMSAQPSLSLARVLIKEGAKIDARSGNDLGLTPLMVTVAIPEKASPELAELLIAHGADVNAKDIKYGLRVLRMARIVQERGKDVQAITDVLKAHGARE